jgi:hypothetical protein
LSPLGSGAYTVKPTKSGQVNGISGLDAARVAQHVAGLISLNANQQMAGDATNNGGLSGLDAARIAQFAAGLTNPGIAGQWKFLPGTRSYPGVANAIGGENYEGILVGDVTGNWTAPAAREDNLYPAARNVEPGVRPVPVTLPGGIVAAAGRNVIVPIVIGETAGKGVIAYDFTFTYDPNVLTPDMTATWGSGTRSSGWSVVVNTETPGQIRVTAYGTSALSEPGVLLNLEFKVSGRGNVKTGLKWPFFQLNEGEVPADLAAGSRARNSSNRNWLIPGGSR